MNRLSPVIFFSAMVLALSAAAAPPAIRLPIPREVALDSLIGLDPQHVAQTISGRSGSLPSFEISTINTEAGPVQVMSAGFLLKGPAAGQSMFCQPPDLDPSTEMAIGGYIFMDGGLVAVAPTLSAQARPVGDAADGGDLGRDTVFRQGLERLRRVQGRAGALVRSFCRDQTGGAVATPENDIQSRSRSAGAALFKRLRVGVSLTEADRDALSAASDIVQRRRSADGRYEQLSIKLNPPFWRLKGTYAWREAGILDGRVIWTADGPLAAIVAIDLSEGRDFGLL